MTILLTSGKPDAPHVWHLPHLSPAERTQQLGHCTVEMPPVLTASAVVLMLGIALGQAVVALEGHWRFALGWVLALVLFGVVTALGDDLFLRVELGMLASSIAGASWMALFTVRGVRHHERAPELDLAEAVAEMPMQP